MIATLVLMMITGTPLSVLTGHTDAVNALCTMNVGRRSLLVSAGQDRTVRLWNLVTGEPELSIPVHHPAIACVQVADRLVVAITAGILALKVVE